MYLLSLSVISTPLTVLRGTDKILNVSKRDSSRRTLSPNTDILCIEVWLVDRHRDTEDLICLRETTAWLHGHALHGHDLGHEDSKSYQYATLAPHHAASDQASTVMLGSRQAQQHINRLPTLVYTPAPSRRGAMPEWLRGMIRTRRAPLTRLSAYHLASAARVQVSVAPFWSCTTYMPCVSNTGPATGHPDMAAASCYSSWAWAHSSGIGARFSPRRDPEYSAPMTLNDRGRRRNGDGRRSKPRGRRLCSASILVSRLCREADQPCASSAQT